MTAPALTLPMPASDPALRWPQLFAYGSIRMPLALLELPMFVLLPILYNRTHGMALETIGLILFATRAVDAVADPLIGALLDRWRARIDYARWVRGAMPVLALGFAALLLPPVSGSALVAWLALASIVAYIAYSFVSIAYQAWGASLSGSAVQQVRLTTTREAFGLVGVLAAAALLDPGRAREFAIGFALLAAGSLLWARSAPAAARSTSPFVPATPVAAPVRHGVIEGWARLRGNQAFTWLLAAFMFNGIASAIPATLVLFFASDVLRATPAQASLFLAIYFLAAALAMPFWASLARRIGLRRAWMTGILIAVAGFVWTLTLGAGDGASFMLICAATGIALGSDLALPPALLALAIDRHGDRGSREGAYFGLWNLATKLNLAIAAGVALPLSQWLAEPGRLDGTLALGLVYAALPSLLKLGAGAVLLFSPRAAQIDAPSPINAPSPIDAPSPGSPSS